MGVGGGFMEVHALLTCLLFALPMWETVFLLPLHTLPVRDATKKLPPSLALALHVRHPKGELRMAALPLLTSRGWFGCLVYVVEATSDRRATGSTLLENASHIESKM